MISILEEGRNYLKECNVLEPEASSEFLLSHVLGVGRAQIRSGLIGSVSRDEKNKFLSLIRRRSRHEPLSYVTGNQPFLDLTFLCGAGVLIPRPETEELVFKIFKNFEGRKKENLLFLDIGAGTGAISISLAHHFKQARVFAIEKSLRAMNWMKKNLGLYPKEARRISLRRQDMLKDWGLGRLKFDLIVSNPPYIPSSKIRKLEPEILREPRLALDGGPDGLKYLRRIFSCALKYLRPNGTVMAEIGFGQGVKMREIMRKTGFGRAEVECDFAGIERFAVAQRD